MIRAYHFVGEALRDGSPIPPDGEWLEIAPPIKMCERGLHASDHPLDALKYAPSATLCLVELDGEILRDTDKLCATKRRIVKRIDATALLRSFARQCALDVVHLWDAPPVVREYLETGDETKRAAAGAAAWAAAFAAAFAAAGAAAWAAAWAAARDAAWAAARDAAEAAAWAAAVAAQRERFAAMVTEAFA